MPIPILPLDVVEEIIDILSDDDLSEDIPSVKACSLVCRAFLHICRKHIFTTVDIDDDNIVPKLHQLLSDTPEIAGYIRDLTIADNAQYDDSQWEIFKMLTRLKCLHIHHDHYASLHPSWSESPHRLAVIHLFYLPSLTTLTLIGLKDFVMSDLAPCANLRNLGFSALRFTAEPSPELPASSSIKPLNLSIGSIDPIVRAHTLAVQCQDGKPLIDVSAVTYLSMDITGSCDADIARNLFNRCAGHLVDLNLEFAHDGFEWIDLAGVLNGNPSLRTLKYMRIEALFDTEGNYSNKNADSLRSLAEALEQMSPNNIIENIAIDLHICTESNRINEQRDKWSRFDKALARSGWPKLRHVSFDIMVICDASDVAYEALERDFPKFRETQFPLLSSSTSLVFEFEVEVEGMKR